jgi:hypothetical protein
VTKLFSMSFLIFPGCRLLKFMLKCIRRIESPRNSPLCHLLGTECPCLFSHFYLSESCLFYILARILFVLWGRNKEKYFYSILKAIVGNILRVTTTLIVDSRNVTCQTQFLLDDLDIEILIALYMF